MIERVSLNAVPAQHRVNLPPGTIAERCTACGEICVRRPDYPNFDPWETHGSHCTGKDKR